MVYTVTFNPALDYTLYLDKFVPGGLNRSRSEELRPGGKGINVSLMLKRLGVESVALAFAGGLTGGALAQAVQAQGVNTDFIDLPGQSTRINVKLMSEGETEINAGGPVIGPDALGRLVQKLTALRAGDILVLAGSAPRGATDALYRQLLRPLCARGVRAVVDAEGELLAQTLACRPFLIKPNRPELEQLFGRRLGSGEELAACVRTLQQRGARNVLVSLGAEGALLLDEKGGLHRAAAPAGTAVNSIGAGDSMVAGFLAGYLQTGSWEQALRYGVAAGSATAFASSLASRQDVLRLL